MIRDSIIDMAKIETTPVSLAGSDDRLKLLLLAGGMSTRMGTPKHLLRLDSGQPLCVHIAQQVKAACPELRSCFLSLRRGDTEIDSLLLAFRAIGLDTTIIYDDEGGEEPNLMNPTSLGPAAGMRTAHLLEPQSSWLVVACDFPLLSNSTIDFLVNNYRQPVTCYRNAEGFIEPLLAIWSPEALRQLTENVTSGSLSPSRVIKMLNGHSIDPPEEGDKWLWNTNTPEEWQRARRVLREEQLGRPSTLR